MLRAARGARDVLGDPTTGGRPGTPTADEGGAEARFRVFDRVSSDLRDAAGPAGLVLVLDDLQAADRPSVLLLRHLFRELAGTRILVLATRRVPAIAARTADDVLVGLVREPHTERLELAGLDVDAVAAQLDDLVGRPLDPRTAATVHEATRGNPFFVGELAQVVDRNGSIAHPRRASGR